MFYNLDITKNICYNQENMLSVSKKTNYLSRKVRRIAMFCQNKLCIYWEEDECILDEVELDFQGKCTECIYIDIDDEDLKKYRKKSLSKFG